MSETKNERIHLRCTADFKTQVEELAEYNNRSVSNYIETVLREKIEEYAAEKKKKKQ